MGPGQPETQRLQRGELSKSWPASKRCVGYHPLCQGVPGAEGSAEGTNEAQLCQLNPGQLCHQSRPKGRQDNPPGDHPVLHDGQGLKYVSANEKSLLTSNTPSSRLWHLISSCDAIPAKHGPDLTDSKLCWAGGAVGKTQKAQRAALRHCGLAPHSSMPSLFWR